MSEEVHLSRSQLARAFDATIGVSPMAYLRRMRVEQMARLLSTTDLTIAEAARGLAVWFGLMRTACGGPTRGAALGRV